jgi:hypothetical protein
MSYEMNAEGVNGVSKETFLQAASWQPLSGSMILQVNAGPGAPGGPSSWDPAVIGVAAVQCIGYGNGPGVMGQGGSNRGAGVVGIANNPAWYEVPQVAFGQNAGVLGVAAGDSTSAGVFGQNDVGNGVSAVSNSGTGVAGTSESGTGISGVSQSGTAVHATSNSGFGVDAFSPANVAVHAISSTGIALYAQTGPAFLTKGPPGKYAGLFMGPVAVDGPFTVFGTKGAAVKDSKGSYRQLFCLECPESWFEDFGEAKLVKGKAKVKLDPQFASVVKTKGYHVFLSAYGNSKGLYVSARTTTGFSVREQDRGNGNIIFSYRIVARRKDVVAERLPKFKMPGPLLPNPAPKKPRLASRHSRSNKPRVT